MPVSITKAAEFMLLNARLIDRARFAYHFEDGQASHVIAALGAYQNPDGGFGNALEPDLRAPVSQPEPVDLAIMVLDEVGAVHGPILERALSYLDSITRPDGGVPNVLASVREYPHAPWWEPEDGPLGALIPTASIAGYLLKNGIEHQWLDRASSFCWNQTEDMDSITPYRARALIPFLDHAPDRTRAEQVWEKLGQQLLDGAHVALDPFAEGEVFFPLDYAPTPHTLARRIFSDELLDKHLDALEAKQQADGGWRFNWRVWTPITEFEWRGSVTVGALNTLRAYGRL